ncbi:Nif3-like dinuclear metal center hexameric protein [Amphibacillus sp. Q70]|uniref:Nif3-like dinuclear metal center hexameric protein n=1 Tax=Amphibacillus sp. Q70 TaxID=3453416 RepID=UPI003F866850
MTKSITVGKVIDILEEWVPKKLASDWDNVGLQIGNLSMPVNKVMTTLDVTEEVVEEAIETKANLIISHHPLLFKPLKQINLNQPIGKIINLLIKHDISVYSAHTNLDIVTGGVNDLLAAKLALQDTKPLVPEGEEKLYKLHVYVPESHQEEVDQALTQIGVGQMGEYKDCSFSVKGIGSFTPSDQADPFLGEQGIKETVEEVKLEYMLPDCLVSKAVQQLIKAHPYEEPAFDLIELSNKGEVYGLGRIGTLPAEMTLKELTFQIKDVFQLSGLRVTGPLNQKVRKVAVLGGSGEKYYQHAKRLGADVYLTGDVSFHYAQDAQAVGLSIIDPGHHIEAVMIEAVHNYLDKCLTEEYGQIEVIKTSLSTEPFQFL